VGFIHPLQLEALPHSLPGQQINTLLFFLLIALAELMKLCEFRLVCFFLEGEVDEGEVALVGHAVHGYIDVLLMHPDELLEDEVGVELYPEEVVDLLFPGVLDHDQEFVANGDVFAVLGEIDADALAFRHGFAEDALEQH
jgi:hypothetical protein